jgi:ferritin-like metal-binding protein YciE
MVNKKSPSSKMMEEDTMLETDVSKEFINFLVDELNDIYWAEKHLVRALPKMVKAATDTGLKGVFAGHAATSRMQVERLEQVFELLGETPRVKKCEAMAGLVEDANGVIEGTGKGTHLRDAGLVLAAQKVESYEIATYSALVQLARTMGNEDIISLLEETLSEEKEADELLTALAEGSINYAAATEGMEKQKAGVQKVAAVYQSVNLNGKNIKRV